MFFALIAFLVLIAVQILGLWLVELLALPVPGVLLGIALMLLILMVFGRLPRQLATVSNQLLAHLMLLFIPSIVAIMTQVDIIAAQWLPFLMACIVATAITMMVTAAVFNYMLQRQALAATQSDAQPSQPSLPHEPSTAVPSARSMSLAQKEQKNAD